MTPSWACRDSWQWGTCWGRCPGGWSSPGRQAPSNARGWGPGQHGLMYFMTDYWYFTQPPSPRTSSPSDMSSVACGQSGHTTPMEDSDKRKCTFNFCFLILSERMIKSSQRWFKGHWENKTHARGELSCSRAAQKARYISWDLRMIEQLLWETLMQFKSAFLLTGNSIS